LFFFSPPFFLLPVPCFFRFFQHKSHPQQFSNGPPLFESIFVYVWSHSPPQCPRHPPHPILNPATQGPAMKRKAFFFCSLLPKAVYQSSPHPGNHPTGSSPTPPPASPHSQKDGLPSFRHLFSSLRARSTIIAPCPSSLPPLLPFYKREENPVIIRSDEKRLCRLPTPFSSKVTPPVRPKTVLFYFLPGSFRQPFGKSPLSSRIPPASVHYYVRS